MSTTVIDTKTEKRTFKAMLLKEHIDTTIALEQLANGAFGLSYNCHFYGVKAGKQSGGPFELTGNVRSAVQEHPTVILVVSNFQQTAQHIRMDVAITIDFPIVGTKTIYNQTLEGQYQ